MLLGEFIKNYRIVHDLSAEQFARLAGLSRVYISNIENNYNPKTKKEIIPTSNVLQKCAKAMGISLETLILNLDDAQLINVVYKSNPEEVDYKRDLDLNLRYSFFTEELCNREEVFTMGDYELDENDLRMMLIILGNSWKTINEIIAENHKKK